ncbi:MAG: fumarylacetoacetase [Acidimicrobiia bacterium]|nr:fumarylacetoacetase [Acidimicrobiia bacterium]
MTWAETTPGFGLDNLPYGVAPGPDGRDRIVVRIGDAALDLAGLTAEELVPPECGAMDLVPLMAAGPERWAEVRGILRNLLVEEANRPVVEPWLVPVDDLELRLPFPVADYVDFYSSEAHATNVGRMFRPDDEPLLPNWRHLPVGYHGRAGTVVVSGTPIRRPVGQRPTDDGPSVGPTQRLDFELEVGFVVGTASSWGRPVPVDEAEGHLFGAVLLDDWSARDIQAWEYRPLGPFLGKSFATSISAWVVPMAALDPVRVAGPSQDPAPPEYLQSDGDHAFAIDVVASIRTQAMRDRGDDAHALTRTDFRDMYWTAAQQVAHLTVNGASLRTGDLLGSGTVSGWDQATYGSLLELAWNGEHPVDLPDGSTRSFLEDGDEVILTGWAGDVALGPVAGTVVEARA